MTIDVNELYYGCTDVKPVDMDWTEGWTERWEFTGAEEVEIDLIELPELTCSACEQPVSFMKGRLTHVHSILFAQKTATGWTPRDEDHEPELELEENVRFVSADDDTATFLVAGSSPHVEAFGQDHYIGDGPMMSYWYPIDIDDNVKAAMTLAEHSLPLCVVEVDGETGLALTGGGMDLSWEICMAFIVLGYLPPLHFCDLPGMAGKRATPDNLAIVAACKRSAEAVKAQADRTIEKLTAIESALLPPETA